MWGEMVERPRLPCRRRHDSPPRGLKWSELKPLERAIIRRLKFFGSAGVMVLASEFGVTRLQIQNALRRVMRERFAVRVRRGVYGYRKDVRRGAATSR